MFVELPWCGRQHVAPAWFLGFSNAQAQVAGLQHKLQTDPTRYTWRIFDSGVNLILFASSPMAQWRICIPSVKLDQMIHWYHMMLNHVSINRLYESMTMHFYHSNLRMHIENMKSCYICQRFKLPGNGYGMLPPREASLAPWQEIIVDLIEPWSINVNNINLTLNALMITNTVTNLAELIRISNKSAAHVGMQLESAWLSHDPRPQFLFMIKCPNLWAKDFNEY